MKLRKVEKLCKQGKRAYLYNQFSGGLDADGMPVQVQQWVGDGHCLYPIHGLPTLDEESLMSVFDVSDPDKFTVTLLSEAGFDFSDAAQHETVLDPAPITIRADGRDLWPMTCSNLFWEDSLVFVDTEYLAPMGNDDEMRAFYLRKTPAGRPYIAVKSGLILSGIVIPMPKLSDRCAESLQIVANLSTALMERRQNEADHSD